MYDTIIFLGEDKMKKNIISLLLVFALIFTLSSPVLAASGSRSYYVSSSGNDNNSGSSSAPFKTLNKALTKAKSGSTIYLRAGQQFDGGHKIEGKSSITITSYGKGKKPTVYTDDEINLLFIVDSSYITLKGVRFSAPNGKGVSIYANKKDCHHITISGCEFDKISPIKLDEISTSLAAIHVDNSREKARVHDVLVENSKITDCAYGLHSKGISVESNPEVYVSPKESYNYNMTIKNCVFERASYGAIIFGSFRDCLVTNCYISECAEKADFACAPVWMHHSDNITIDHCEICNSRNTMDGMAIDFDGWTTNSTYQYIYSHDNSKFMKNCLFDNTTKNRNNTVKYCLSVRDNKSFSAASFTCISTSSPDYFPVTENFTFEHNTMINSGPIRFGGLTKSNIKNNLFINPVEFKLVASLPFFRNTFEGNVSKVDTKVDATNPANYSSGNAGCGNVTFCTLSK